MKGRTVGFVGVLAIALLLVTGAGAGTTTPTRIDLSSMAKITKYLRAMGVNPRTVVVQRAERNYAGPRCPGKGWNCTTRTRVLQVGSTNVFECSHPGSTTGTENNTGGTQTCIGFTQSGDTNTFRCIEKTTETPALQSCGVTQTGGSNTAYVEQVADQGTGSGQDATQTADVTQTANTGKGKNEAHFFQTIKQFTAEVPTQSQDGHQKVTVDQTATGTVGNFAHVHQGQDQREKGAAEAQTQNTTPDTANDCAPSDAPTAPNECALVLQSTSDGINDGNIHQALFEDMATSANPTTLQQQGIDAAFGGAVSGLEGQFEQSAGSQGKNNQHGNQAKHLRISNPAGSTRPQQFDQARCCGVSADGGTSGVSQVVQHADVSAPPGAIQTVSLTGESHVTTGSVDSPVITSPTSPSGGGAHCHVTQHGSINEDSSGASANDQGPFCEVVLIKKCIGGSDEGGNPAGTCTTGPPTCVDCRGPLVTLLPTTPTYGLPLSADIFGEPSDYAGPVFPLP